MIQRYPYEPRLPLALRRMQEQQGGRRPHYPTTAAELAAAIGYGTWSAGWLFDEASGDAAAAFGAPALAPTGSPTQNLAGPRGGVDKAIRIADGSNQYMSGGDVFDVGATDDLCVAWIGKHPAAPGATRIFLSKRAAATAYWSVQIAASGAITGVLTDATNTVIPGSPTHASHVADVWYAGMFVWERGAVNQARVATNLAIGAAAAPTPGALGDCGNTAAFGPGRGGSVTAPFDCSALYVGTGLNAAAGMVANLAAAVANFARYVGIG